ncbi:hypothetical protein C3432_06035 [Citrobacter amalonaticus]|uniref:Uncharacterized protein n=1 Tax=Citrobacter amalonaticus TaxID=35703 RepID=A0A2S4RQZ7_CITAM|nr:hypothetical protein [Citrobacter amalonaticus]POT57519.1 hypothetical protein C3432_06035 [Citrobacter amalonaticus]POT76954.1 hypothetical protein C3436_05785 [Citrobacter amalonaticus]POU60215.1 hypothetical protein C3430_25940 [Citrobacter amalonaticus]POV06189.1 hypothetical protein C3424_13085 [Citrobacter amalonaticus]
MKRFSKFFSPPEEISIPAKPRFWLWGGISLFISFVFISIFIFMKLSFLEFSKWNVFVVFLFLFSVVLVGRFTLYERKKLHAKTWNKERELCIAEFDEYMKKGLYLTHFVLLTENGTETNAQLVWRGESALLNKNDEAIPPDIEKILARTKDAFYKFTSACKDVLSNSRIFILSNLEKEELSFFVCGFSVFLEGFNLSKNVNIIDTNNEPDFFDKWVDEWSETSTPVLLFVVEHSSRTGSESVMIFLFNGNNEKQVSIKVHRSLKYSGVNSLRDAVKWSDSEVIEAIWYSGSEEFLSMGIGSFIENDILEDKPRVINVDEYFGHAHKFSEWYLLALASEWGRNSKKKQLVISNGGNPIVQAISVC